MFNENKRKKILKSVKIVASFFIISIFLCLYWINMVNLESKNYNNSIYDTISVSSVNEQPKEQYIYGTLNQDKQISIDELTDIKYIDNKEYFLNNPKHHKNSSDLNSAGVCTTIAMQMLMGYHNYYNDRRIIPQEFLSENYGDLDAYPHEENQEMYSGQGDGRIGTSDAFFDKLFELTTWAEFPALGQNIPAIANAANKFVKNYSDEEIRENVTIKDELFSKNIAKQDINDNLPIILGFIPGFTGANSFHVVPAYGYAKYQGVDGFLVHYGWGDHNTMVWVPESWFGFQIRMNVEHTHSMEDGIDNYGLEYDHSPTYRRIHCRTCGVDLLDKLYKVDELEGKIEGVNYPLVGQIKIPNYMYGVKITEIGDKAFSNQSGLQEIELSRNINNIGTQAFYNCVNLNIKINPQNQWYTVKDNIVFNKDMSCIITTGKINAEIIIPNTVKEIKNHAFADNTNLYIIHINNDDLIIHNNAFARCLNLHSIYFYNYIVPQIGDEIVTTDLQIYVPYDSIEDYQKALNNQTANVKSISITINYVSNNEIISSQLAHYGETIKELYCPSIAGYEFVGWYDNQDFSSKKYCIGDRWESTNNKNVYAKWEANNYKIKLDLNGGNYDGELDYTIKFGENFELNNTKPPFRQGYLFDGWYDDVNGGTKYVTENGIATKPWDIPNDTILYARWIVKSYEIQINNNGTITWLSNKGLSNSQCLIEYGTIINAINLIAEFKSTMQGYREGYIFDHFEYNNEIIDWTTIPDLGENGGIITIYPNWIKEKHTIYFNTGCQITLDEITIEYSELIELPSVNRTGYVFLGWYTDSNNGNQIMWNVMPDLTPKSEDNSYVDAQNNGSIMLFAHYQLIIYNIDYKVDGGVNNPHNITQYNVESNFSFLAPTKTGYSFIGWYKDLNKTQQITNTNGQIGNLVLYAKWEREKYTIILDHNGGTGGDSSVNVYYNDPLPYAKAPSMAGYAFDGYWTERNGKGIQYYNENMAPIRNWDQEQNVTLYAKWVKTYEIVYRYIRANIYSGTNNSNMYTIMENRINNPILARIDREHRFTAPNTYYYIENNLPFSSIEIKSSLNAGAGNISSRYYSLNGRNLTIYATDNFSRLYVDVIYDELEPEGCVAEGTMITLADGSQKAVEKLNGDEELLVWNMITGNFDTVPILFIDKDARTTYEVINLYFSDGTSVKVISEHAFWDFDLNEYVFLRRDADKYIGHWFNKQTTDNNGNLIWCKVQLINVQVKDEITIAYSPVTYKHLCYYVNGMLSMPGATEGLINIFEVDCETMKIIEDTMRADIETYGLYTYEEFAEIIPTPEEVFNAFNGQYLKISIGKGLITINELKELISIYAEFFKY